MPATAIDPIKTTIPKSIDRKPFEQRLNAMKLEFSSWEGALKEIRSYENPLRGFFDGEQPNQGKTVDHKLMLDSHARRCVRTGGAGMTSGLTSPARPWFKLGVDDPKLMENESVQEWLNDTEQRMRNVFSRSNIYGALTQAYEELFSFATAAIAILEDYDTAIRAYTFTAGEYVLGVGPDGRVNAFGRRYWMQIGALVKEFGLESCSKAVQQAHKEGKVDDWVKVNHLIEINDTRLPDKSDFGNMKFRSVQWEEGSPATDILRISGFEDFPILGPRWALANSTDIYGKGPGWDGLGDCKMLQKLQRKKLLGLDKQLDPPTQQDGTVTGEVDTLPGARNKSSATTPNAGVRPVYQISVNLQDVEFCINETKRSLDATFYTDLFLMLTQSDRRQITAEEIAKKYEEKLWMLGPVLEALEGELLDPLIDRTFSIMLRLGLIADPPPELQGQELKVEYISILAQAQKAVGTAAIEKLFTFAGGLAAINPDAVNKLEFDEAIEAYANMLGISPKIVRSKEAAARIRQVIQDAQAQQLQAQQSMAMAQGAETLSRAKLNQGSALDAVIAGQTGQLMQKPAQPAQSGKK